MKNSIQLIDLHNHLLYGMDDGADSLATTEAMLQDAQANHITTIAATTHMLAKFDAEKYDAHLKEVQKLAEKYAIKVVPGAEYNGRMLPEHAPYRTLGGGETGAVLVDFRIPYLPPEFLDRVDSIYNAECTVILAHPERTFPLALQKEIEHLSENGVYCQVTAGSLLGNFGDVSYKMAWQLLANGQARLIASDAHNVKQRASHLLAAYEAVEKRFGFEAVEVLMQNAQNVLNGPRITLAPIPLRRFRLWDIRSWFQH